MHGRECRWNIGGILEESKRGKKKKKKKILLQWTHDKESRSKRKGMEPGGNKTSFY